MASSTSRLAQLEARDQIAVIPMNDRDKLILGPTSLKWIGTRDLNSCHAVIIQSPICILLAHISPRPDRNRTGYDPSAATQHVHAQMRLMMQMYSDFSQYFPRGTTSSGVYAVYQGDIALPDQKEIINEYLRRAGLPVQDYTYHVPTGAGSPPARGTVVVGWEDPCLTCDLYVEDVLRQRMEVPQKYRDRLALTAVKSRSQTASSSRQQMDTSLATSSSAATSADSAQDIRDVGNAALAILSRAGIKKPQSLQALGASTRAVGETSQYERSTVQFAFEAAAYAVAQNTKLSDEQAKMALRKVRDNMQRARMAEEEEEDEEDEEDDEEEDDEDDEDDDEDDEEEE